LAAAGAVAITPIDADPMARAGALTGLSSSEPGSPERGGSLGNGGSLGAVDDRTGLITGRSRMAAIQAGVVVSAPEELGALPSLLGSDGPIDLRRIRGASPSRTRRLGLEPAAHR
jgi:hypothetical protein